MKVAALVHSLSRQGGGIFEVVRRVATEVSKNRPFNVEVIGLRDANAEQDSYAWGGVPTRAADVVGPRSFGYAPELIGSLASANADLVHQHGLWMYPSLACYRWSTRNGRPYIVSPHGMLDGWALANSNWKKRVARLLYEDRNLRAASCLHALCDAEAGAIRACGLDNPVCVIPNGVDPPPVEAPGLPDWEDLVPHGSKVLLYLGRLHPKKNLLSLLKAWSRAQQQGSTGREWLLVIAGWDQNAHSVLLENTARQLNIHSTVRFVGPQFGPAKHATLSRADAFVLPSLSEGVPMEVLEAWSYRLPVIMTRECNLLEALHTGAAIGCEPTTHSIADAITSLFNLAVEERRALGERAHSLLGGKYSWPTVANAFMGVYAWMLGSQPRPSCVSNA